MFENYQATPQDLRAVEKGLSFVWRKELEFIFQDKEKLENTLVVSYDSKLLYLWYRENNRYHLQKLPHQLKIENKNQWGWRTGLRPKEIIKFLPQKWQVDPLTAPKISGGLLTPFIGLQKRKNRSGNPYTTYESYLATIVHEFAHVYFNRSCPHWYPSRKENLHYLETALKLYEGKTANLLRFRVRFPSHSNLSELFAFCADYTSATLFWPEHKEDIDKSNSLCLKKLIQEEKTKDLNTQDSVLDENPHDFAAIIGKILVEKYPKKWVGLIFGKK